MDLSTATWRKSRHSAHDGGACVEVANIPNTVALRDSKNPDGGHILVTREDFRHLTETLKNL
ncbi:hypothetical protein GCM10022254_74080 [Actinomadura meridiana]|uniref:DUF397 domain-containing protein n=1 Tax=Actinomadura meridiana TaxID=559626 RepID=A0ABP8CQP3_9ACTN